ncbi:His-Xaa-Ser system protein HxsD [Methylacidimicrobium tartarophylax]|uniref:His-Xaa-Ser system protein HxsD n=1 Tax=Methylacidimicrobium tartarophylax TaxID=1041768 RepID=A0A5E6MC29_9BACT|nr:His-Xaa-Ser system protein HxsD [Methylacidimicrobium tartarophylax]VVM07094.1 hypothetical protein MAMT_01558 [Methylacidimicrobium tartarophylax]
MSLRVQKSLYRQSTVEATLYRLADRFSAQLIDEDPVWSVEIHPLSGGPILEDCHHLFRTELIDQSLRAQIVQSTEQIKTLILSNAFSGTSLVPPDGCAGTTA